MAKPAAERISRSPLTISAPIALPSRARRKAGMKMPNVYAQRFMSVKRQPGDQGSARVVCS